MTPTGYVRKYAYDPGGGSRTALLCTQDFFAAQDDISLILLSQDAGMALWATPVWIPTGTMAEWKNTMLAMVHNIWIGVLDRMGAVPDQEGPLSVD